MSLDTLETFPTESERMGLAALGRASLVYALGGLAYKGVALLTIPLLARVLSPSQLGLLDLAAVLASIVGLVAVLGSDQAVAFHEARTQSAGAVWGSAIAIVATVAVAVGIVGLLFQGALAGFLTGDAGNGPIIAAAGVYGAVIALSTIALSVVRLHGTPRAYATASFLIVTAEMALAVVIALLTKGAVALMVLGWAVGATIVAVPVLARHLPPLARPRASTIRRLVTYGAPLVPAAMVWLVGDAWIRATLAREGELSTLGEYGIAYRIASVLGLVVTGFGVAWYPYLYRSPPAEVASRAAQALGMLILVLAGLGVALTALSPEIISTVAGAGYAEARHAIGPLVGGMVALGGFILVGAVVGASGSTRRVAILAVVGAVVQGMAGAWLVPVYALAGAALASASGYVLAIVLLLGTEPSIVGAGTRIGTMVVVASAIVGLFAASAVSDMTLPVRMAVIVAFALLAAAVGRWLVSRAA